MDQSNRIYSVNMFRVCIDTCQGDISGCAHSPICEREVAFTGIGELLLKMDKLFDSIGYPQAFQNKRSFEEGKNPENLYRGIPKPIRKNEDILEKRGLLCTYDIAVESRRNTSWQGIIYDVEGKEAGRFNGEVELLEQLAKLAEK